MNRSLFKEILHRIFFLFYYRLQTSIEPERDMMLFKKTFSRF